jgi:hypothetical protein
MKSYYFNKMEDYLLGDFSKREFGKVSHSGIQWYLLFFYFETLGSISAILGEPISGGPSRDKETYKVPAESLLPRRVDRVGC